MSTKNNTINMEKNQYHHLTKDDKNKIEDLCHARVENRKKNTI